MSPIRTILHPTDFSESAEAAFSVASMLAGAHGARIIVLHVFPRPRVFAEAAFRQDPSYEADLWHKLDSYHAAGPNIQVERRLAEGSPADEILYVADEQGCDLIVMGTHGKTGLASLLTGSVTTKVMRRASCPVLTVRMPALAKRKRTSKRQAVTA